MSNIEIHIIDDEVNARLKQVARQLNQPNMILQEIADILQYHTLQTFANEGDPAHSWAPLARATIRNRKAKGYSAGPILSRSERLKRSVQASFGGDYARLAVGTAYAAAHHYGATIKRQGFVRLRTRNKKGELLRQKDHKNLAVFAQNSHKRAVTRAVNYVITIPARPILPVDENQQLTPGVKQAIFNRINQLVLNRP